MVTQQSSPADRVGLESIRVRSATFRDRPATERADLASRLRGIRAKERVLLETCHRVELVTVDDDPPGGLGPAIQGREAVRRVLEVVGGFDSAVVAEEQLLGQVRGAYEAALTEGLTGPILNELFRRALRFGRRVRTHARPGTDRSLADPGVAWLLERVPERARVVVVGTGEMGRLVALRLAAAVHPITIVSRSADRGGHLLEELGDGGHRLAVGPVTAEVVGRSRGLALAVRGRTPVLTGSVIGPAHRPWVLDLSSPPAFDAEAGRLLGDRLLGVDALGIAEGSAPVLAPDVERRLRAELEEEVKQFVSWLEIRGRADALSLLHGGADAVRRRHIDRLRRRGALSEEQLEAVEAASAAMVGELLHRPMVELRRGGADAATVRRLFALEA